MAYRGHIDNGVVVLDEPVSLLDATAVVIEPVEGEKGPPRRSSRGLWADLGVDITEQDIEDATREMWGNFPPEDIV